MPAPDDTLPRTVGRYEIVAEVGRGTAGRVYLARQVDLGRRAALKELAAVHLAEPAMIDRFLRESRVLSSLNHPNVVTIFDSFEVDGTPYIGMEYVPRGSLRPWVGRLTLAQTGGVLEALLAGLQHAHDAGIVHRDLKPANLMVSGEGTVKIADFGIAKALGSVEGTTTATGTVVGTPAYMAPEQARGDTVDARTDLYSAGVIAYQLLSGSLPFTGSSAMAVLLSHCMEAPPPLTALPPALAAWVERMIAKAPDDRFASARDAWLVLEDVLVEQLGPLWRRHAKLVGDPTATGPADDDVLTGTAEPRARATTREAIPPPVQAPARRRGRGLVALALAGIAVLLAGAAGVAALAGAFSSEAGEPGPRAAATPAVTAAAPEVAAPPCRAAAQRLAELCAYIPQPVRSTCAPAGQVLRCDLGTVTVDYRRFADAGAMLESFERRGTGLPQGDCGKGWDFETRWYPFDEPTVGAYKCYDEGGTARLELTYDELAVTMSAHIDDTSETGHHKLRKAFQLAFPRP